MSDSDISILVVEHLENLVLTETALSPEKLQRRTDTRVFRITDRADIDQALAMVDGASTKPTRAVCDVRWGLTFAAEDQREIRSLYLDGAGRIGIRDRQLVEFTEPSLIEWLRGKFGADSVLPA